MTQNETIPMAKVDIGEDAIADAVDVLRSGRLVQGAKVKEFERAFADFTGAAHAVAVNSGTAALHVAYLAALKPGDEVLVPVFSHISTASMAVFAGAVPIFCDIRPDSFTIDLDDARTKITPRTKAVAPVHLFGNACPMDDIAALAEEHGLCVIGDAAQAHGTLCAGRDVGSLGDMTCYSFYPTKNMTTGEGGMVTTNSDESAEKCRLLRAHWQTEKYFHPNLGLNYRMRELEAAIGLRQLERLPEFIRRRRENAAFLTDRLAQALGVTPPLEPDYSTSSYHQYSILLDTDIIGPREDFMADLKRAGVASAIHYPRPIHRQPAFVERFGETSLPVSEDVMNRIMSIPVHPGLTPAQLEKVAGAVCALARNAAR